MLDLSSLSKKKTNFEVISQDSKHVARFVAVQVAAIVMQMVEKGIPVSIDLNSYEEYLTQLLDEEAELDEAGNTNLL